MIVSDRDLTVAQERYRLVEPWNAEHLQPASIDLTLGNEFIVNGAHYALSTACPIAPREFLLATTVETITMPDGWVGKIEGRSTWGRRGLIIETAGFVDPGFSGQITLELYNVGPDTLYIPLGERICQIIFSIMTSPAHRPYGHPELGSHYQGQKGVTPAWRS